MADTETKGTAAPVANGAAETPVTETPVTMTTVAPTETPTAAATEAAAAAARPEYIPEKFWNAEAGAPRLEEFAKSYGELERSRLERAKKAPDEYHLPATFKGFEDQIPGEAVTAFKELAKAEGYSQRGFELLMQGVYGDPAAGRAALQAEYGDKLDETLAAVGTFANTLGDHAEAVKVMTSFPAGVKMLNALRLAASEQPLPGQPGEASGRKTEAELRSMMADAKYWRDKDPAHIAAVTEGFRQLYGDAQVKTAGVNPGDFHSPGQVV
jgi:hypothetical protein